ncbi:MAG TPA: 2OG-Fe(II) oxygenase, partial [Lysobacter sp.]
VDEALFPSTPPIRSDLSCTVFLNDPSEYDGGELTIQLGAQELAYKLKPGSAILYPSTTIHRVTPVTRGVRIAAITWLQSWVADSNQRELLVQLEEARGLAASGGDRQRLQVLLESLRTNLFRMWADT